MKIVKASAGSGKTWTLSRSYIGLLLESDDRYAYRHILAVTFTNKATAEMKSRILRDLAALSETDEKAKRILIDILHDYSAFSISTIDKFFQQALKAFSREIGQFSSYQVELDRDSLITEAMDRILDGLTEDKRELVDWLRASVNDQVEQGERFSIDKSLYDIGKKLKSEEHRRLKEICGITDEAEFSKERLKAIRRESRRIIKEFHEDVQREARNAFPSLTTDRTRAWMKKYTDGFRFKDEVKAPGKMLLSACEGTRFADLWDSPFKAYNTARTLDSLIFSLGLAGEFYKEFEALVKEKNVMPLDDSNTILRDIIDGSDAPFVYEKLGVRYEHFLLDEFQDTSGIQWENFLPLLRESESRGSGSLVVGDVKQSIYRWRDSDWRLLGTEVAREFPDAEQTTLGNNWRSFRTVVQFNNGFFEEAAGILGVTDIYSDVKQNAVDSSERGYVRVEFTDDQMQAVYDSIARAHAAGASFGDIAVLVRGNKEGAAIASGLIGRDIPVLSDDSLALSSSSVVRRLVALLQSMENPGDSVSSHLVKSTGITLPDTYHSLLDLCEGLLRELRDRDASTFEGETLFISAFMDDLRAWVDINGNNLRYFLEHWSEKEKFISSPQNSDSVRILTIHKSKGLEFPYVIFPYADKVELFKSGTHWCLLDANGSGMDPVVNGIYPTLLGSESSDTLFGEACNKERMMQTVDNINVFYVALTRAVSGLHIISATPTKTLKTGLSKGKPEFKKMSDILYKHCGCMDMREYGDISCLSQIGHKTDTETTFPGTYASFPIGDRLLASEDATDFFGEDGCTGAAASARLSGIVLHRVLSSISGPEDLAGAVDAEVCAGELTVEQGRKALEMLTERAGRHPEWFGCEARNELSIFDTDGTEHRPDRVLLHPDGSVTVIDYKFGAERASYRRQVSRYCDLYRRMGHADVRGFLWYVPEDRVCAI